MKKCIILLAAIALGINASAQEVSVNVGAKDDDESTVSVNVDNPNANFRLFTTRKYSDVLKLNTADGRIWKISFSSLFGDGQTEIPLNPEPLVSEEYMEPGRFTIYPTNSVYILILLDTIDGYTWQINLSKSSRRNPIIPIELGNSDF